MTSNIMTTENPSTQPEALTQHQMIAAKIAELQAQLLANHPMMPQLLREIHATLKNDPAVVTLCTEEETSIIFNGLQKQTNTYLVASMTKTTSAKNKALKNVTTSDLGFD